MTSFTLNGREVTVADDHPHLLSALREELDVTSPKDGNEKKNQKKKNEWNRQRNVEKDE
jgi:aerobic-type carbon monoxide dehydrogenase small subunit (CoxS/CutS family)